MDLLDNIKEIASSLNEKYPEGNEPSKIISRLSEALGELAKVVNHYTKSSVRDDKKNSLVRIKVAGECRDAVRSIMQIVDYYDLGKEFTSEVEKTYSEIVKE